MLSFSLEIGARDGVKQYMEDLMAFFAIYNTQQMHNQLIPLEKTKQRKKKKKRIPKHSF